MQAMQITQVPMGELLAADVPDDAYYKVARSVDNNIYTNSVWIAESSGKQHKHVLETIDKIINAAPAGEYNNEIYPGEYKDASNRVQRCYILTISGLFAYCTRTNMPEEQVRGWAKVISALVNKVRNAYNIGISNLTAQLAAQQNLALPQGEELLALAVIEADKILKQQKQVIASQQVQIQQQTQQIAQAQPAVEFAAAVNDCNDTILVYELAANITQRLTELGIQGRVTQNSLYKYLREHGYVNNQKGIVWNKPRVKALQDGLLKVRESIYKDSNGNEKLSRVTGVTGKGQLHFMEEILQIYKNGGTI